MSYPDYKTYEKLYARFFDPEKTKKLMGYAGDCKDKTVMDICAGSGRITIECIRRGVEGVVVVEQEHSMILEEFRVNREDITLVPYSIEEFLRIAPTEPFIDIAICQQGINYWLDKVPALRLANIMVKDGVFIFNTFNIKPPSVEPLIKSYKLQDKNFTEITWSVKDNIYHVQIREGMAPHLTTFKWMDQDYIFDCLDEYFLVSCQNFGKSVYYKCIKK